MSPNFTALSCWESGMSGEHTDRTVDRADSASALADGGRNALHRPVADVAGSEHRGDARLKRKWRSAERGPGAVEVVFSELHVGEDEAAHRLA